MWVIIQLTNKELRLFQKEDEKDGRIFFGYSTKKEALEQVKKWKWCDLVLGTKYKYVIEREENI